LARLPWPFADIELFQHHQNGYDRCRKLPNLKERVVPTVHEQQARRGGIGGWSRTRWLIVVAVLIAVAVAVMLIVIYSGGGSGGTGGGY
jgi:hypothetical protein